MGDLHDLAENVKDEQSFLEFVHALAVDREQEVEIGDRTPSHPYGPGARGWENGTIEAFLSAAAAWGESSINGMDLYKKPANAWTRCAQILLMGKHYE